MRPPRGGPQSRNHADFFPFSGIHAINKELGFSRKNAKIGRKTYLSRNHACFSMISRNHAHFWTFSRITHASGLTPSRRNKIAFTQSRRNKIDFTKPRRKIRSITQSRNPMGGLLLAYPIRKWMEHIYWTKSELDFLIGDLSKRNQKRYQNK